MIGISYESLRFFLLSLLRGDDCRESDNEVDLLIDSINKSNWSVTLELEQFSVGLNRHLIHI